VELQEALTIIELQRGHIAALELQVSERDDSLREAHVEIALLRFETARLRRALYGDKSERFIDDGASSTAASTPGAQGAEAANDSADTAAADAGLAEGAAADAGLAEGTAADAGLAEGTAAASDTREDSSNGEDSEPVWPRRRGKVREHERTYGREGGAST
jgi:hypothetical protein